MPRPSRCTMEATLLCTLARALGCPMEARTAPSLLHCTTAHPRRLCRNSCIQAAPKHHPHILLTGWPMAAPTQQHTGPLQQPCTVGALKLLNGTIFIVCAGSLKRANRIWGPWTTVATFSHMGGPAGNWQGPNLRVQSCSAIRGSNGLAWSLHAHGHEK